ncbi:MAG: GNAT family N-acetyltransferase [Gallionellales bacterium 35-53-114]|jgi:ribosomal protein S18 acetylase RimI-like enzyme|nr:MAG: GNAT family N-acetyltransferase [Gallionellales bacterium 35-53-114]OYZ65200.1 MAG: GNAT family N-acetyltransferase [Gallionellales bacterium 24-53-125]OZB08106.1 MAG: GNAT family N-acetyltransferase [Gallionellales bacterium 39-52-133]HQS58026.1 N-acetyltransferase [Gallionellaceae bacterium]HQS73582.1 N-acetyltransferase [Gallionellaceae bacterium]
MLTYRPAVLAEVESVVALVNAAYRGEASRAGWTTEADLLGGQRTDADEVSSLIGAGHSIVLLCFEDAELTGTVHLHHAHRTAHMGMLVIKPGLQGQGRGKKLMQAAEAAAIKMWGADKMLMHVITLRHELIAFYERRGYRRTGKIKAFPDELRFGIPKVAGLEIELMEKTLDAASFHD